jgi:outer membrane protein assembly factor BamD
MRRALLGLALVPLLACAHGGQPDIATLASNSDRLIWDAGQKALQKREWDSARQHFRRIIDGFPQSEIGPDARLALADSYWREGGTANYILAVSAYREFLTFYPSHPKSAYAQFQVGECFFKQRSGPDRDQTATLHALEEYQKLLDVYSASEHVAVAKQRITETRQSLARAEFMAGYFYQKTRQSCRAAIARYEGVVREYPDFAELPEVLFRLGDCLIAAGRQAEAPPYLSRLVEEYPTSSFVPGARRLLARPAPAATPAVEPSPGPSAAPVP